METVLRLLKEVLNGGSATARVPRPATYCP